MVMSDINLIGQVKNLMNKGIYDPNELFKIVYNRNRVHYAKVREAIHIAKGW
jgi:hypothetical protein